MGTPFEYLPIDDNGIVQGVWRLVHASPLFDRELGGVRFVDGMATEPVCHRRLRMIIAEYGGQLFLEPWKGDLPRGFVLPEAVNRTASPKLTHRLPRAPWRDAVINALMPLVDELLHLGGERAPDDFARMMSLVPSLTLDEAQQARTLWLERAASLRKDGYVEIPKALLGAVAQCEQIIARAELEAAIREGSTEPKSEPKVDGEESATTEGASTEPTIPPVLEPPQPSAPEVPTDLVTDSPELVEAKVLVALKADEAIPAIKEHGSLLVLTKAIDVETSKRARTTVLAALKARVDELMKATEPKSEPPTTP